MSIGLRDQRCEIFADASNAQTGGDETTGIARVPSGASDGAWWCRVEPVSARESNIAANSDHQVDVVVVFGDEVEGLSVDGAIRHNGTYYKISGYKPARLTRETIVTATYTDQSAFGTVTE